MQNTQSRQRILFLTQFSLLLAIEAVVSFTPLGSIPFTPLVVATLSHIPVIIAAILLGTGAGAAMGGFFGLFSFLVMSFISPGAMSFAFTPFYSAGEISGNGWSLVICFVPRILIGVVTGVTYKAFSKRSPNPVLIYGLPSVLGALTTTVLVLGGIWLFFGPAFADVNQISNTTAAILGVLGTVILTNGIPEAAIAGLAGLAVCMPLKRILSRAQK